VTSPRFARQTGFDYPLLITALLLSALGLAMVYSAGQTDVAATAAQSAWQRQSVWFCVALVGAFVITRSSVRLLELLAWPAYLATVLLLTVTLVFGTGAGTAESMKGWLTIGGVRLGQPSELAKLTVVLMFAKVLAGMRSTPNSLLDLWKPLLVVAIPALLVLKQPDLGTGLVFVGISFGMLFWSGVPWPLLLMLASPGVSLIFAFNTGVWGAWFLVLLALLFWYRPRPIEGVLLAVVNVAIGVVAPLVWDRLNLFQQRRLLVFLDPQYDPQRAGYQVLQSIYAIGSGGFSGKGFTLGTQKRLGFLPAHHTDFIFSVVGEELGFLGVSTVLGLFLALFLRSTRVAQRGSDMFASLVAFGLATGWFVHVVVNIGMTLNLMPITGIPLPFFSYGGSFLLSCWLAVAVLLRISSEGRGKADGLGL
jgi:rod shape determining protein RodA